MTNLKLQLSEISCDKKNTQKVASQTFIFNLTAFDHRWVQQKKKWRNLHNCRYAIEEVKNLVWEAVKVAAK